MDWYTAYIFNYDCYWKLCWFPISSSRGFNRNVHSMFHFSLGLIIEKILPWNVPSILYISIIGLLIALPWSPVSASVIYYTSKVDLISITAILLAYAGIAMGKDLKDFKKVGIKGIVVTCFVIFGTYFASALIAQLVLSYTGMI